MARKPVITEIKINQNLPRYRSPKFIWRSVRWALLAAVLAALITNFVDKVHYDNLLTQADNKYGQLQTKEAGERADLKFTVTNFPSSLNCYDLLSDYGRSLCQQHDANQPQQ